MEQPTHLYARRRLKRGARPLRLPLCAMLLIASSSCIHEGSGPRPVSHGVAPPIPVALTSDTDALAKLTETADREETLSPEAAFAANAALPLSNALDGKAAPFFATAVSGLDQLRSLDCLAQTIYYEARSESEGGQRAVAQVVLNRLRHPSYPASVCGVVYQGPMRAGGGCQFTFTCDGSLARTPRGPGWLQARRIAAEMLSGTVYAPVGHATHYHTTSVFPRWAPRLVKAALIGNHIFYRLPGTLGAPAAFRQAYAGREPAPAPARQMRFAEPRLELASLDLPSSAQTGPAGLVTAPPDDLPKVVQTERGLPDSRVREAWQKSGRIRDRVDDPQATP